MSRSSDDLPRLLAIVPYLVQHPHVPFDQAVADLQTSEAQLRKDLDLLVLCGPSKYYGDNMIWADYDGDTISLVNDQDLKRPLRLSADEATALLVALRTLAETPGLVDVEPVRRALAKVEDAAGVAGRTADMVAVALAEDSAAAAEIRRALENGRAVRLHYWSAARDVTTERVVDPIRLLSVAGRSYLEGWCRLRQDVRTFHLGRVHDVTVLDEQASPPIDLPERDTSEGLFQPSADDLAVHLVLEPSAAWVAEYYPIESSEDLGEGRQAITLRARDEAWVRRFVLSLGPTATLTGPSQLVESVREVARSALAAYTSE